MIKKVLSNKQLLKMELAGSTPEAAQHVVQAIEQARFIPSHVPSHPS
jgi:hypothetical protein